MQDLKKDLSSSLKNMLKYVSYRNFYTYDTIIDLDRIKWNECSNVVHLYFHEDYKNGVDFVLINELQNYVQNLLGNVCKINFYVGVVGGELEIQIGLLENSRYV